jgi:ABC-type arginine transport system ATPase subunit
LRYIKYDFFVIVYVITMALMDLGVNCGKADTLLMLDPEGADERSRFNIRGENVGLITGLIMSIRVM